MDHIYDIIIIGGGPAGYTAALYASRAGFNTLVIEKMMAGGQMTLTGEIDNYPGFDQGVDGFTLSDKMQNGAHRFGAQTIYAEVLSVSLNDDIKIIKTSSGELYARVVIIATGASPRELEIDGEKSLIGRGVHYCAHCDGRFYKGKTVVVVGGGNSAVGDALYLSRLAQRVILVHRRDTLAATKVYFNQLENTPNIEFCWSSVVDSFIVNERLEGINIKNTKNGEITPVNCDGVFVSIGRKPITEFLEKSLELDKSGYIVADETTKTNIDGVFAIGDVRTKALRQIVTAVSDGAVAIHYAEEYLSK